MGGGQYLSPNTKIKRMMDLSMPADEKILRTTYGNNVDNYIKESAAHMRGRAQRRNLSTITGTERRDNPMKYLTASISYKKNDLDVTGGGQSTYLGTI